MLLHHTTKDGRQYRGSVQLGAAVDLILTLRGTASRDGTDGEEVDDVPDDGRRRLVGKGRGISVDLRLTFDGMRYRLGDTPIPLRQQILAELVHGPASGAALADRLHRRKENVLDECRRIRDLGLIHTVGKEWGLTPAASLSVPALMSRNVAGTGAEPVRNRPREPVRMTAMSLSVPPPVPREFLPEPIRRLTTDSEREHLRDA